MGAGTPVKRISSDPCRYADKQKEPAEKAGSRSSGLYFQISSFAEQILIFFKDRTDKPVEEFVNLLGGTADERGGLHLGKNLFLGQAKGRIARDAVNEIVFAALFFDDSWLRP